MKRFMPVFLFVLLFGVPANAQMRWGARIGVVDGEPMIGGDLILKIGSGFWFNPNVELSTDVVTTNADAHYDFEINRDSAFWVGAGIALINPKEQDLDVGVNLLAGLGVRRGRYILYTQVKRVAPSDYDGFNALAVGVRF